MDSGIYQIVNILTNKKYIGSAKNITRRFYEHKYYLEKNDHVNIHLQRAWYKDGESNFTFDVIEYCDRSILLEREQYHIDSNDKETLYNLGTVGGGDNITNHPDYDKIVAKIQSSIQTWWDKMPAEEYERRRLNLLGEKNPNYGNKWTDDQRKEASIRNKKRFEDDPHLKEILSAGAIKWWDSISHEQRQHISEQRKIRQIGENNSFYGKNHSEKTKQHLSEVVRERYTDTTDEKLMEHPQTKPMSINGAIYPSLGRASAALGVHITVVRYRCNSKTEKWKDWFYI